LSPSENGEEAKDLSRINKKRKDLLDPELLRTIKWSSKEIYDTQFENVEIVKKDDD